MHMHESNQLKVVPEPEILAPRDKEQERGVADTQSAGSMRCVPSNKRFMSKHHQTLGLCYLDHNA